MNLTNEQKEQLKDWITEGLSLSTIYKHISNQWKMPITYMELRFLIDDLNLEFPKEKEQEATEIPKEGVAAEPDNLELLHNVSINVDKVVRPGTLVSGSVTFSDGMSGTWQLDQQGRIGLIPSTEGYRPSQEDIQEFQIQLQEALHKTGY